MKIGLAEWFSNFCFNIRVQEALARWLAGEA
jgi:hypothetical protein